VGNIRCDFGKWDQDEGAFVQERMGDDQLFALHDQIAVEQDIQIRGARAPMLCAVSAQGCFDPLHTPQQGYG
jgi:hypothetical protein